MVAVVEMKKEETVYGILTPEERNEIDRLRREMRLTDDEDEMYELFDEIRRIVDSAKKRFKEQNKLKEE